MKVGIFQFNGCHKCYNETLLLGNGAVTEVVRVEDPKAWKGDALDAAVIAGYLTSEDRPTLKVIADHAKKLVAYGSCAATGGLFGLAAQKGIEIVPVHDYYPDAADVHGCLGEIEELTQALKDQSFDKTRSLCKVCTRKSDCEYLDEVVRQIDVEENPETCYNDQGLMCNGFIAVECKEACMNHGTPCRGCKPMVDRPGFRMLGMWATLMGQIEVATEATGKGGTDKLADVDDEITDANPDVVGQFFRFGLASSVMPIGRQPTTGNIYGDIFTGRIIEELPLITGMMGCSKFVSFTLDVIEAYEEATHMKVSDKAKSLRADLLKLEGELAEAAKKGDKAKYAEVSGKVRAIAGNMNLSNVYFGGFKTPVKGAGDLSDYKYQLFEVEPGTYQKGMVKYALDERGVVTEFTVEV